MTLGILPRVVEAQELRPPIGKYRIVGLIGTGGMGVVYRALDPDLGRHVALKVLKTGILDHPQHQERFRRECRAAGRLAHPGLVRVYDTGVVDGAPYLVMELVEGVPLSMKIHQRAIDPAQAVGIARDLCDAAQYLHENGVVHRDIKPSNIMLTPEGRARILDFGLAIVREEADAVTTTGEAIGTPRYMAPEQLEGRRERVDARADLYAIGAVLYEMLAGRPPIDGQNIFAVLAAIRQSAPPPPSSLNPAVPRRLDAICLRCLAKEPEGRYGSGTALKAALEQEAPETPAPLPPLPAISPTPVPQGPVRIHRHGRRRRASGIKPLLALLALAAVPVAAILAGWPGGQPVPGPPATPESPEARARVRYVAAKLAANPRERKEKLREALEWIEQQPTRSSGLLEVEAKVHRALGEFQKAFEAAQAAVAADATNEEASRERQWCATVAHGVMLKSLGGPLAPWWPNLWGDPGTQDPDRLRLWGLMLALENRAAAGVSPLTPKENSPEFDVGEAYRAAATGTDPVELLRDRVNLPSSERDLLEASLWAIRGDRARALRVLPEPGADWRIAAARATLLLQESKPNEAKLLELASKLEEQGQAQLGEAIRKWVAGNP
jgi:predicted Ser/Thr protein kinase